MDKRPMTENEKLRALLAEAREWIIGCACDAPDDCDESNHLPLKIDAALAEPVDNPAESAFGLGFDAGYRRGVERLQGVVDAAALGVSEMLAKFPDKEHAAYQRGAEAMREAAARLVDDRLGHILTDVGQRIRALPVPEDKP